MKETTKLLTFQEVKVRLEKVQKALEALQVQEKVLTLQDQKQKAQLISLRETLENKLNILTEMDKGVIHTDDEKKAKDLAKQGVQVKLLKKGETLDTGKIKEAEEGLQFDESQTREIAKEVAKAVAMALKQDGMQIASAKILRLEPMAFDTYFQYKDSKEDEFSFHIDQDRNIILSDFTFSEKIGEVGLKGAGTPHVNVDVIKNNLLKIWAKLDGNMREDEDPAPYGQDGDLMAKLEKALQTHDWYYMMSDDHRYYKRGSEEARNIHNLITKLKEAGQGEEAEALYKSYHQKNRVQEATTNEYKIGDKVSKKYASTDDDFHNEYEIVSIENGRATVKDLKTGKTTGMAISDLMVAEASIGSIQKKHGELVAKMKTLAAQYKGGDQSVIPQLKAMTIEKKKLEAELDAKVAGTGADQELSTNVDENTLTNLPDGNYFAVDGDWEETYKGKNGLFFTLKGHDIIGSDGEKFQTSPEEFLSQFTPDEILKVDSLMEAEKAKKDFDKDGKVEKPEEEYKGVKDKAIKKATSKTEAVKTDYQKRREDEDDYKTSKSRNPKNDYTSKRRKENPKEAVKAKKDFDKDGDIESPEAEYRGVRDKAIKKATVKEEAIQSYADLEAIANDTSKMPKERDEARQKMYAMKKPSRGTKLAETSVNEGQFSWFTQDTDRQIGSEKSNKLPVVYMIDDKGKKYIESDYEGYGVFGGMDYYELLDVMNGGSGDRQKGIDKAFGTDPEATEDIKFPALVTNPNFDWQSHDFTKEPKSDPNQGWAMDSEDDYYEDEDEYDEDEYNEGKHETELTQDPKTKEFTRRVKMTPKDMETITKVQDMMAKEKSMKKEGEGDETAVDLNGKAYSIGDIIDFKGQMFQAQIGPNGRVILQHLDAELQPKGTSIEGGDPKFQAILRNSVIVNTHKQIDEGGNNPEGDAMVLRFLKGLTKKWDIPMQHAVYFVQASIKRQGY